MSDNENETDTKKKNKDLKIYPLKIEEDKLGEEDRDILGNAVHLNVFLGRIRSGKTTALSSLYLSPRFWGDTFDVRILISSSAENDVTMKYLNEEFEYTFDEFSFELLDTIIDMVKNDTQPHRYLLVLDDIMADEGFKQKRVGVLDPFSRLITKFRHIGQDELGNEGRLSICLCLQRYKFLNATIRQNIQGFHIMGSFPQAELKKIAEDYSFIGGDDKEFMNIFSRSRKEPFDFLYINVPKLEAYRNYEEKLWDGKDIENKIEDDTINQDESSVDITGI